MGAFGCGIKRAIELVRAAVRNVWERLAAAITHRRPSVVVRRVQWAFVPLLLLLLLGTACVPTATSPPNTGIEGQVLIGPMCPVVQVGAPCPDQPYQATISVRDSRGEQVAQFESSAQGQFKLPLVPGDYVLVPESPDGFTHAAEQAVMVVAGQYTLVTITYDSGIR